MSRKIMVYCKVYSSKESILKEWYNGPGAGMLAIGRKYIERLDVVEHYGFALDEHGQSYRNELEAETVKDIFWMHLFGVPAKNICQHLVLYQSPIPKGYSEWSVDLIQEILADERYAGYKFIPDNGSVIPIEVGWTIVPKRVFAAAQALNVGEDMLPQMERLNRFCELMRSNCSVGSHFPLIL